MSVIWIRHAEKAFDNGKGPIGSFQHDPDILKSDLTKYEIKSLVLNLLFEYGYPDKIICSPFVRTRQTLYEMTQYINKDIEIEFSTLIGEYLGFAKKDKLADISPETNRLFSFPVYLNEGLHSLHRRTEEHLEKVKDTKLNVWIITHGFVMCKIYENFTGHPIKRPNPLDYMVLKNNILKSYSSS